MTKIHTVALFGNVPAGTKLHLTQQQASARMHALSVEKAATASGRGVYIANQQLGFKAGEEIGVDGKLDRGLEAMLGISASASKQNAAEKKLAAAGVALTAAREADAQAKAAVVAADEAGKAKAEKAAATAAAALDRAQAAFVKAGGTLDA